MKTAIAFVSTAIVVFAKLLVADFRVNEENYRAHWVKDYVVSTRDEYGDFIFVWIDSRMGVPGVYAQRLTSSGVPIDSNFKVNEDTIGVWMRRADVACLDSGKFAVVWQAHAENDSQIILARRFRRDGQPIGASFVVDTANRRWGRVLGHPAIAGDRSGRFVIVWSDSVSGLGRKVLARRYGGNGQPIDTTLVVSDSGATPDFPDVSFAREVGFVVIWYSYGPEIFAQLYDSSGNRVGGNFLANDRRRMNYGWRNYTSCQLKNGGFALAWNGQNYRPQPMSAIFARVFGPDGQPLDSCFKVNQTDTTPRCRSPDHPSLFGTDDGGFIVAWRDGRDELPNIFAQRFDSVGHGIGDDFMVNDTSSRITGHRLDYPTVAGNNNKTIIAWRQRYIPCNYAMMFKVYDAKGIRKGNSDYLNDDVGFAHQFAPSVARGPDNRFMVTWTDTRRKFADVYERMFDTSGNVMSGEQRVNVDTAYTSLNIGSSAACNGNIYLAVWAATIDFDTVYRQGIMGQKYDLNGSPVGGNFWISDWRPTPSELGPSIAAVPGGGFVATWQKGYSGGDNAILAQRFDRNGSPVDSCFRVNDQIGRAQTAAVGMAHSGEFVIAWAGDSIWYQRYDSAGRRLGSNVSIRGRAEPSAAFGHDCGGNFVIAWACWRWDSSSVYAQRFTPDGDTIGPKFRVNDSVPLYGDYPFGADLVCRDPHEFFICFAPVSQWTRQLVGQYYRNGIPVGRNQIISDNIPNCSMEQPSVTADSEHIYITWVAYKYEQNRYNYDVYAKIIKWSDLVDVEGEKLLEVLNRQFRVYPNPARARVTIVMPDAQYLVPKGEREKPTLAIYDILGRVVKSFNLASGTVAAASAVTWDGRDEKGRSARSGVYFCQLKAGERVLSRKLVLIAD